MDNLPIQVQDSGNKTTVRRGQQSPQLLLNNITLKPIIRSNSDIKLWREALRAADRGKRVQLYNLYEDLLLDNILFDSIDKRIKAITNSEITFTRNDGVEDAIDTLIDSSEFEQLLTEIMLAQFWGITVIEMEFTPQGGIVVHSLPRKHLRPQWGEVAIDQAVDRGIPYRDNDFVIEVGHKDDLGQILRAAPYVIYKRNNTGDWAEYVEIFGRPIRVFTYETYDDEMRVRTTEAAKQSGGNLTVVMPQGAGFEIKAGATSGDGEIYDKLRKSCNEEILIGILGQTLTTTQGQTGARSLGEVHMQVQDAKHKADRRFVQRILNSQLIPILERRGYPVSGGFFYFPEAGEQVTLEQRMSIIKQASTMVPISTQYVYQTMGIPAPEQGDELITAPTEPPELEPQIEHNAWSWRERVRGFFAEAPLQGAQQDIEITEQDSLEQRLCKRIAQGHSVTFDGELYLDEARKLVASFREGLCRDGARAQMGIEYDYQDPAVITAMENNLYRFSAGKTIAQVQQLNEAYRHATSFEQFAGQAQAINNKYRKDWAQTEYITAGAVAESTSSYQRLTQKAALYPYWEYKTLDDGKVRVEHVLLHGLILPANDPLWRQIYPPNGWRCRCYVVPRMLHELEGVNLHAMRARGQQYLDSEDYKNNKKQGFGANRAIQGVVFEENQNYVNTLTTNKTLNNLSLQQWGLKDMERMMNDSRVIMPHYSGSAEQWASDNSRKEIIALPGQHNRVYMMSPELFARHTKGKYAKGDNNRVQLLAALKEVLSNADEIWLNAPKNKLQPNNLTYIKYYDSQTVVALVKTTLKGLYIYSWFCLDEGTQEQYRRGMLVKKAVTE